MIGEGTSPRRAATGWGPDLAKLSVAALGVVYGDIGTSPLYAVKECFTGPHGVEPTTPNVLGVISLVFWALVLVVVFKYVTFITRADHDGEGGILALLALVTPRKDAPPGSARGYAVLLALGLFGAALLYGDGVITPAISVLSAVEGLEVATPVFQPFIVPITAAILVVLFWAQKRGTGGIGAVFGPAMIVWFVSIGAAGLPWIVREPGVLAALDPTQAVRFFAAHRVHGFFVLGAVVLCITGGEALYADMGHFGSRPIRLAWYAIVFPALLLNYFGQGALLIARGPSAAANPFYALVPSNLLYPMVVIATAATVIASQAMISGAFSLTHQAVQLGLLPRVTVVHTSGKTRGQIYVPEVSSIMMVACVLLVLAFQKSTNLAGAYGIAVTGTMAATSVLFFAAMRTRWGPCKAGVLTALFLVVDLSLLGANVVKIPHGGWFSIAVATGVYLVMATWRRGRRALASGALETTLPLESFLEDIDRSKPHRVPGTSVFMTLNPNVAPSALLHNFKHNKVVHEQVVLLTVTSEPVPEVPASERVVVKDYGRGFYQVMAHYGFMQAPNVPDILKRCAGSGLNVVEGDTSFYLGRETLVATGRSGMRRWRTTLFSFLSRNAHSPTAYFGIPPNRVVELGTQVEV
jgi:KUP system potassium uptake protein